MNEQKCDGFPKDITFPQQGYSLEIFPDYGLICYQYKNRGTGRLHRTDDPAVIYYDKNGLKVRETYYQDGIQHRIGGPAYIEYDENALHSYEQYLENGEKHRKNGPAVIYYDAVGNKKREEYWKNGVHII